LKNSNIIILSHPLYVQCYSNKKVNHQCCQVKKEKHLKFTNKSLISSRYVAKKKRKKKTTQMNHLGEPTARQHINLQASHSHLILFDFFFFLKEDKSQTQ
jgi:hypothetical protein